MFPVAGDVQELERVGFGCFAGTCGHEESEGPWAVPTMAQTPQGLGFPELAPFACVFWEADTPGCALKKWLWVGGQTLRALLSL